MKNPPSKVTKCIMILFIIFIFHGLVSCKTKQKTTEREKEKIVSTLQEKSIDKTILDIKTDSFAKKGSSHIFTNENQSLELTQADPNKKIIVEDEKGNKLHITGANAVLKNNKETSTKKDTSNVAVSKTDKSKLDKSKETKTSDKKESSKRNTNSDVKTTSIWMWVTIGLVAIVIIGLVVFKKQIPFLNR